MRAAGLVAEDERRTAAAASGRRQTRLSTATPPARGGRGWGERVRQRKGVEGGRVRRRAAKNVGEEAVLRKSWRPPPTSGNDGL